MRRIIVLAIAVAGLVFAAQANALDEIEILAEKATGTIEVNPSNDFACRALNTGPYSVHLGLLVQNQDGDELASDLFWVEPWESVELKYDVPSTPVADRTVVCKVHVIDAKVWGDTDSETWLTLTEEECVQECPCDQQCFDMCLPYNRQHMGAENLRVNGTADQRTGPTLVTTDGTMRREMMRKKAMKKKACQPVE